MVAVLPIICIGGPPLNASIQFSPGNARNFCISAVKVLLDSVFNFLRSATLFKRLSPSDTPLNFYCKNVAVAQFAVFLVFEA